VRVFGYCLASWTSPAQIRTEFAAGGSPPEALPRLDDTGKTIVVVGLAVGMKIIHSRGVIQRDLKPGNILLHERGHLKTSWLGSSRFCDLRLTLTSRDGTPMHIAPEMYEDADCTAAVDVYSFALIVYEGLVGEPVFPATTTLPVLFQKVSQGDQPPLPQSMDATIQQIVTQGWSVDRAARGSFEGIWKPWGGLGSR
jgi:serine/threonine-protein kinase